MIVSTILNCEAQGRKSEVLRGAFAPFREAGLNILREYLSRFFCMVVQFCHPAPLLVIPDLIGNLS